MSRKRKRSDVSGDHLDKEEEDYVKRVFESIERDSMIERAFQFVVAQFPESDPEELWERVLLRNGLLECQCCFDDLAPDEAVTCINDHFFCKACLVRQCEACLADARAEVKCMTECPEVFRLATLESTIPNPLFTRLLSKVQSAELATAQIEGLETCPFCEFAYIPEPAATVFECLKPECLKKSCRLCKEVSHVPSKCTKGERPKDVEARLRIEEKMSEALYRTCPRCKRKFIKINGCNHVRCPCGADICYFCGKLSSNNHKCPVFSSTKQLHDLRVQSAGESAKEAELAANPDVNLVHDPTTIVIEPARKKQRRRR